MKKIISILLILFAGSVLAGDYGHGNADSVKWATAYDIANMVDKTGTPTAGYVPKFHDANTLAASSIRDSVNVVKMLYALTVGDSARVEKTLRVKGISRFGLTAASGYLGTYGNDFRARFFASNGDSGIFSSNADEFLIKSNNVFTLSAAGALYGLTASAWYPGTDNARTNGTAGNRWSNLFTVLLTSASIKDSSTAVKITHNAIGDAPLTYATTMATGLSLRNLTPAAVGAQQSSPPLFFRGAGWKTAATAGSQTGIWRVQMRPAQGSSSMDGPLQFDYSLAGADFVTKATLTDDGGWLLQGESTLYGTMQLYKSSATSTVGFYTYTGSSTAAVPQRPAPSFKWQTSQYDSVAAATKNSYFVAEAWGKGGGAVTGAPTLAKSRWSLWGSYDGSAQAEVWSVYGDGTPSGKTGYANGEAAFSTNASIDTVTIAEASASDIYTFEWTSAPGATAGSTWIIRSATGFTINTTGATIGNPSYMWTRRKALP